MEFHPAQGDQALYQCAECGEPVLPVEGRLYRPCGHNEAAAIANMEAVATGVAALAG